MKEEVRVKRPTSDAECERMAYITQDFFNDMGQFAENIKLLFDINKEVLLLGDVNVSFVVKFGDTEGVRLECGRSERFNK